MGIVELWVARVVWQMNGEIALAVAIAPLAVPVAIPTNISWKAAHGPILARPKELAMPLFLRKVPDLHREMYRVILKNEDGETELGSIALVATTGGQYRWRWGIDTVVPMREHQQEGYGADRKDCQARFKAAWEKFASDPANLVEFMRMKRQRQ